MLQFMGSQRVGNAWETEITNQPQRACFYYVGFPFLNFLDRFSVVE